MRRFAWLTFLLPNMALAQPFAIGERTASFYDAARDRTIACEIRYPGITAGSAASFADGAFPVLVFGHGFVMTTAAYANLWEHFVPLGYVMVLPTTEGGILPDHADFGQDLAFAAESMQAAGADIGSPFFGHVAPATALMGHSMGGGASFLGAAGNASITTVVNLAAAETNPSAVSACADVLVPTLMFAGSNDCVTPIADHTAPMFEALTVPCRAFINVTGGGHCYFAQSNFNCNLGELTCSPAPAISRAQQHAVVNDFATLWLDHFLKGDADALAAFVDSTSGTTRAACTLNCLLSTDLAEEASGAALAWPNPACTWVTIPTWKAVRSVRVLDAQGRGRLEPSMLRDGVLDVSGFSPGMYMAIPTDDPTLEPVRFMVNH